MIHLDEKSIVVGCDFETDNDPTNCHVWLACCGEPQQEPDDYAVFTDLDSFLDHCFQHYSKAHYTLAFHNLAFDGDFLINHCMQDGYRALAPGEKLPHDKGKYLRAVMTDMGQLYTLELTRNGKTLHIWDSWKVIPLSEHDMCEAFGLQETKGSIDYVSHRPVGYKPTRKEIAYVRNDVKILNDALKVLSDMNLLNGYTIGMIAAKAFRETHPESTLKAWFPSLSEQQDTFMRQSYYGGVSWANPKFRGKHLTEGGCVYDANSLYPSQMILNPYPTGQPHWFQGSPPFYRKVPFIVRFRACFEAKPKALPFLQMERSTRFHEAEHITSSDGRMVEMTLTSVDLKNFFECYVVYGIEYLDGYWFRWTDGIFDEYVNRFRQMKIEGQLERNPGKRQIGKLFLNNLYGKFGTQMIRYCKVPYLDPTTGLVEYETVEDPNRGRPIFLPVACFVTSYGRRELIKAVNENFDRFCYCDTDSVHLVGDEPPEGIRVDDTAFGAWKLESRWTEAKYIHSKTYVETIGGERQGHVCGLPTRSASDIPYDQFEVGYTTDDKLAKKKVKGGTVLENTTFTIQ